MSLSPKSAHPPCPTALSPRSQRRHPPTARTVTTPEELSALKALYTKLEEDLKAAHDKEQKAFAELKA